MWPFSDRKRKTNAIISVMPIVVDIASEKWTYFCDVFPFKDEIPLVDRIQSFFVPFSEGLRSNFSEFRESPDSVIMLVIGFGIERSGTHSRDEIELALNAKLPNQ